MYLINYRAFSLRLSNKFKEQPTFVIDDDFMAY